MLLFNTNDEASPNNILMGSDFIYTKNLSSTGHLGVGLYS